MSLENKILEQRLIYKDSVVGISSLSRCTKSLLTVKTATEEESGKSLEGFVRELLLFKLEVNKASKALHSIEAQQLEYTHIENDINQARISAQNDITSLNTQLLQEQEMRKHRLTCEEIAVDVNKQSARSFLKRKMHDLNDSVSDTTKTLDRLESEIKIRREQYDQLLHSLRALEEKVFDDDNVQNDGLEEDIDLDNNFRSDREERMVRSDGDNEKLQLDEEKLEENEFKEEEQLGDEESNSLPETKMEVSGDIPEGENQEEFVSNPNEI
jgi:hypothetical protein